MRLFLIQDSLKVDLKGVVSKPKCTDYIGEWPVPVLVLYIIYCLILSMKTWAAPFENVPCDVCAKWRFRSSCSFPQSDLNLHSAHFGWPRMQSLFMWTMKTLIRQHKLIEVSFCAHVRRYIFYMAHIIPSPEVIKLFSCSTQLSMKLSSLINMKTLIYYQRIVHAQLCLPLRICHC